LTSCLGFATRYVVGAMMAFMLVATFSSHAYWTTTDANLRRINDCQLPEERQTAAHEA
jgi:uncharacterized membrane protein YphA (DoxX/SURF4 family)